MRPEDIKINQLVEVELEPDGERLASRVEEIKDDCLYISMPMRKGALVSIWPGQTIRLIFKQKDGTFGSASRVITRKRDPLPYLVVDKPQRLAAVNQKREFVRLPVALKVRFRVAGDNKTGEDPEVSDIKEGTTIDISAGGLLFTTPEEIKQGQILELEVKLPGRDSIYCHAQVVRVFEKRKQTDDFRVALIFSDIQERQRDSIFRFIFEKQREWIKKGL